MTACLQSEHHAADKIALEMPSKHWTILHLQGFFQPALFKKCFILQQFQCRSVSRDSSLVNHNDPFTDIHFIHLTQLENLAIRKRSID
jgi:hypothetical protein